MAKKRCSICKGVYTSSPQRRNGGETSVRRYLATHPLTKNLKCLAKITKKYLLIQYNSFYETYTPIITVLAVLLLILLFPTIKRTIQANSELKELKNTHDMLANEATYAELTTLNVADEVCSIDYTLKDKEGYTPRKCPSLCSECLRSIMPQAPPQMKKKSNFFQRLLRLNETLHRV